MTTILDDLPPADRMFAKRVAAWLDARGLAVAKKQTGGDEWVIDEKYKRHLSKALNDLVSIYVIDADFLAPGPGEKAGLRGPLVLRNSPSPSNVGGADVAWRVVIYWASMLK